MSGKFLVCWWGWGGVGGGLELCLAIFVVMQQPFEEETAN